MGYDIGDSFFFKLKEMEFHLVQNRKENCHHDYILFNMKGRWSIVFSVYDTYGDGRPENPPGYEGRIHKATYGNPLLR